MRQSLPGITKHLLTCSSGKAVASLTYSWAFFTFSLVSSVQLHATALLPPSDSIFIRLTTASPWLPWSLPFTLKQTFCPGSTPPHSYFANRWKVRLKRTGLAARSEGNCFSSFPVRPYLIYRKAIIVSASKKTLIRQLLWKNMDILLFRPPQLQQQSHIDSEHRNRLR